MSAGSSCPSAHFRQPIHATSAASPGRGPKASRLRAWAAAWVGVSVPAGAWVAAVDEAARAEWDVLLTCVSFPKQELFAHALRAAGRRTGVALCVGASVDFLTGRQQRAPRLYQALSLEWLHRLMTQPKRMFRRYVVEGPAIFGWFMRTEVLGRG